MLNHARFKSNTTYISWLSRDEHEEIPFLPQRGHSSTRCPAMQGPAAHDPDLEAFRSEQVSQLLTI
jgi:hypothetical protein